MVWPFLQHRTSKARLALPRRALALAATLPKLIASGCLTGEIVTMQAKLIRAAMEDALLQWKARYPGKFYIKPYNTR